MDLAGFAYQYDVSGNVRQIVEAVTVGGVAARTILSSYDGVYRLIEEELAPPKLV